MDAKPDNFRNQKMGEVCHQPRCSQTNPMGLPSLVKVQFAITIQSQRERLHKGQRSSAARCNHPHLHSGLTSKSSQWFLWPSKVVWQFPHPKGQSWSSSVWHSVWPEVPSHPLPNHQTLATAHIGGSKQSCPWPAGSAPRFHHHEQSPQEPVWPCCSKLHKSVLPKFVCPPNKSQGHRLTWWAKIDCHCLHKELLSDCLTTWAKKQTQNLSSNQWQCPWQLEQNFSQKLPQTQSASPIFQSPTSGKVWHERLKLDTNNTGKFQAAFFVPQKLGAVFGSLASNSKTCKYCMFAHKHCSLSDIWHVPVFDSLAKLIVWHANTACSHTNATRHFLYYCVSIPEMLAFRVCVVALPLHSHIHLLVRIANSVAAAVWHLASWSRCLARCFPSCSSWLHLWFVKC